MNEKEEKIVIDISADAEEERIDKLLAGSMDTLSRSFLQKLLKDGNVSVNGKIVKANYRVKDGDRVEFFVPPAVEPDILPENIPLSVLYEDEDVLVVDKPKGMVVHPAPGNYSGTLVNALLYRCGDQLSGIGGVIRPGIVHRIDKDTSGLLVVAKNDAAHLSLAAQIASHTFERRYLAICRGNLRSDEGEVDAPIGRHPVDRKKMAIVQDGKAAQTHFTVLERFGDATMIACRLKTGRTHQIRVHMASLGHPLLGDTVYGGEGTKAERMLRNTLNGQCLHAATIAFCHPRSGELMRFEAPMPAWFETVLAYYRTESSRGN